MISPFAPASTFAGQYRLANGVGVDGQAYEGLVVIQPMGIFGHVVAHIDGQGPRFGLAALLEGRLLVAWGPKDKVEIGAYRVQDNKLTGIWVPPGASGDDLSACGIEISRYVGDGEWEIEEARAIDQQPYSGHVSIKPSGLANADGYERVDINWTLHDGVYASFGLRHGAFLVSTFSFEPEKPHAISVYDLAHQSLTGHQVWNGQPRVAMERWERAS